MNIDLDFPEIAAAKRRIIEERDTDRALSITEVINRLESELDSLIDACFRNFASEEDRRDLASTNYSRARALLSHATHHMTTEEYDTPGNSLMLGIGHALLAFVERDLS